MGFDTVGISAESARAENLGPEILRIAPASLPNQITEATQAAPGGAGKYEIQ